MKLASMPIACGGYVRPEPHELTPRDRHEIREREIRREKADRGWATRNRFPIYCLK